ncbi:MAG TPA: hypothetical protein VE573_14045 [Nitrososphaeraceae archaeon]|jgi:hypothetical protein|nr:hypothetical protein [Nitrososphaeraceae archaeon]
MNQYCKTLVMGLIMMTTGLIALSTFSVSALAQDQAQNQSAGDNMTGGGNMTAEGGNMTLQTEGTSGTNQSVTRNESAGGGGMAPS